MSLRIFDEFSGQANTPEEYHRKRIALEPLVFDILKQRYYNIFDTNFTQTIPRSNKNIVIIERRVHENFAFILRNAAYYGRGWGIIVVCSDINLEFCREAAGKKASEIIFMPLFKGHASREEGKIQYNSLLQSSEFYKALPGEFIVTVEMDSYFRKHIPDSVLEYDYIAAPYNWDTENAGGGLSFRRLSVMIDICDRCHEKNAAQDIYITMGVRSLGYKMPDLMEGITYVAESCLYEDPVAVHQWWTFFDNNLDDAELILREYVQ